RSMPRCRYPLMCGASSPPPHPRSTSTAPARAGGGMSRARAAARPCSIVNTPPGRHHSSRRTWYCARSFRRTSRAWHGSRVPTTLAVVPRIVDLLRSSHPEPAAAVTAVAALLAVVVGRHPGGVAAVAATIGASQLCVGWTNDWLDVERDRAVGRTDKPVAAGRVSRRAVGLAAVVAGLLVVPLALL